MTIKVDWNYRGPVSGQCQCEAFPRFCARRPAVHLVWPNDPMGAMVRPNTCEVCARFAGKPGHPGHKHL